MSHEPLYDTTQKVSQTTTVPKNNFDPAENDEGVDKAYIVASCEKIARRTFRITSRCKPPQTRPLDQLSFKKHSRPSAHASILFLSFGARCRSDARGHGLLEARLALAHGRSRYVGLSASIDRSFGDFGVLSSQAPLAPLRTS